MEKEGRKFGIRFKVLWSIASFGSALVSGTYGALLTIFYQDYLNLGHNWIALAALIYAIWNAFNDPLFGFISDNTKSKHGRRIPYMRFTAPFLALFFILVWTIPGGMSEMGKFWWMLITMLLYDTAYTIIGLVYSALLPEITESDNERGSIQTYASVFSLIGTILGFLLPDMFRANATSTNLLPIQIGMITIGIIGGICVIITSFSVKERPEFTQVDEPLGLLASIKYTFRSKAFLILTAANFMSILMQALIIGSMYYLADYVLQVPSILPLVFVFLGLLIGTIIVNLFAKRWGFVQMQQILLTVAGVALISITFVPHSLIYICLFIAGMGLSGPQVLTNVLFAQVADEDELKSGVRREASFFGTNALFTKPAQSVALAIVPYILAVTHFITREENNGEIFLPQPAEAVLGIKIFIGLIPGIALLLGALILMWYPLRGARLAEQQQQILSLHAEKHAKLNSPK
jgi:GPH family glycoside/pentoside/hexuronide:cation symporter